MGSGPLPAARDPTRQCRRRGGSAGRWPAITRSRPAAGATKGSTPCGLGVRALACGKAPAQGVVPAAGRQLQEAGQRPALPGDPPCGHRVRALACGKAPAQGVVPAAGRQLQEAGQRPALPGDPPCVHGVRALACGKGSDPAVPAQEGSAGRWPAIAGRRPAAGATRRSTAHVHGVSPHPAQELVGVHRPAQVVALQLVATQLAQVLALRLRLHALGHHLQLQGAT